MLSCISFAREGLKFLQPGWRRLGFAAAAAFMAALCASPPASADGTTSVVAKYDLHLAGIALASFNFSSDIDDRTYTISGRGDSSRLVKLITKFKGSTKSIGAIDGERIVPASYELQFNSRDNDHSVEMRFNQGRVDELALDPPHTPSPERVPVKPAHQAGVLDPLSSVVLPLPSGKLEGETVCARRLPIFDGRHRYDLVLSYKRTESVPVAGKPDQQTTLFICKIKYSPIAGHKPHRASTTYWQNSEDMEVWLAPVTRAGLLVPYRATLPTPIGPAVLSLSKLEISAKSRHAAVSPLE